MRRDRKNGYAILTLILVSSISTSTAVAAAPEDWGIADFSLNLMKQTVMQQEENKSIVLSPVSAAAALAMAEAGASGETLEEMETVLGGGISAEDYRAGLFGFLKSCESEETSGFCSDQSVWINGKGEISLQKEFTDLCREQIGADIMVSPFDDTTADRINTWVGEHTDGQIEKILEEIPETAMIYLVDTTVFQGEWQEPYGTSQVMENEIFHTAAGEERSVTMLSGTQPSYIQLEGGEGFVKSYQGNRFDFVALLPPEDVSLADYLDSIDGQDFLQAYREKKSDKIVYTQMPEMAYEFEVVLNDPLEALGMRLAFTQKAEFDRIMSEDSSLYLSQVFQKVKFELDRNGTKAAAASVAEMLETGSEGDSREVMEIILNRPFLFGIVEMSTGIPVFLGMVQDIA